MWGRRPGDVRWVTGLIQRKRYLTRINFITFVTFKLKFFIYSKYTGKSSTSPPLTARLAADCPHTSSPDFLSDRPAAGSPLRPERQGGFISSSSSSSFSHFLPSLFCFSLCYIIICAGRSIPSSHFSYLPLIFSPLHVPSECACSAPIYP